MSWAIMPSSTSMLNRATNRLWDGAGGLREVLLLAFPLILSTGTWSIQHFVDRMFLTWYSPETIAAAMPAGMLNFSIVSLFMGTASYANTFVAQYYGAGQLQRIGPAVWQGVYVALIGGLIMLGIVPFAEEIFTFIGHDAAVIPYEVDYFSILCMGSAPAIIASALSCFFSGRGNPWPVLWVNVAATILNLVLDYMLIFGYGIFPELGIRGAALATVASGIFSVIVYLILMATPEHNRDFKSIRGWRFDPELFRRLVRFGLPSGVQFFFDMAAFTMFVLLVGRLGVVALAATSITFNINGLAFMPMIGLGIATSVLVGQYLGRGEPDLAERSTYSAFGFAACYMLLVAAIYLLLPQLFLAPFEARASGDNFAEVSSLVRTLIKVVAIYALFDAMNIIFASAIKGAGDTAFVMRMILIMSISVLVLPCYLAVNVFNSGILICWFFAALHISLLGLVFYLRFRGGKWKHMRVIEANE